MPYIETNDHTSLYYRSWGRGKPVVFVSAWAIGGEMWEHQMLPLSEQGLRCIAYDRRGHGRSDDPGTGYEFDRLADDLADFITQLDLSEVTLVGCSMGCVDIARYIGRHGSSRIARIVFVSAALPCILEREDNPFGAPRAMLDYTMDALHKDRILFFANVANKYFALGSSWPAPDPVSSELVQWAVRQTFHASAKAVIECGRTHIEGDFRPDLRTFTVPTLVIHGQNDQNAPLDVSGRPTAQEIPGSELRVYEDAPHGLFFTHKDRLNEDLLAFIQG